MIRTLMLAAAKPYIRAELPKWGKVYSRLIGDRLHDPRWTNAPRVLSRNKVFGYVTELDLSYWGDRNLYFLGRWHDLPAQLLLVSFAGGTVIDIGMNRGDFALAAAHLCKDVICFEPNPEMVRFVKRELDRNSIGNVTIHEVGLSDERGSLTLRIPEMGTPGASFGGYDGGKKIENIPICLGDDLLSATAVDLIKIDVEGFECHVIRGLEETITKCQPVIITEVVPEHLERCGSSKRELYALMNGFGYHGHGMSTRRRGRVHELALGVPGNDVLWLPPARRPEEFRATTRDLRDLAGRGRLR